MNLTKIYESSLDEWEDDNYSAREAIEDALTKIKALQSFETWNDLQEAAQMLEEAYDFLYESAQDI